MRIHLVCLLLACEVRAALLRPAACTASRRDAVNLGLASLAGCVAVGPAAAFDNAVPEYANYADKTKRRGTPPKDLGVSRRTINDNSINADPATFDGLRGCDGTPNCFSTTGDTLLEDRILTGVDTLIQPWRPPTADGLPFASLAKVVKAYTPGQGYVDGGGFRVVAEGDACTRRGSRTAQNHCL